MNSLIDFFENEFNTQREQWEKALLGELKLTEVGNKTSKKFLNGKEWPTLSLDSKIETRLSPLNAWKKASTTYVLIDENKISGELAEDIKNGVRNFFFFGEFLTEKKEELIREVLSREPDAEIFILGKGSQILSGEEAQVGGGDSVQELALLTKKLIQEIEHRDEIFLGVYVDSLFFQSMAKLRAARLLAMKVQEELGSKKKIKVIALTSFTNWTLFERYSNMLRNLTGVSAAYIGGADHIQSAGYNTLFEIENAKTDEHSERSQRMARNTSHVLALESMLGVVHDSAYGSYHIENLTQYLCEESWKLMQKLLNGYDVSPDIAKIREERLRMIKTRKSVLSGINDYPDVKEELGITLKAPSFFRTARVFEELRLRMQKTKKPEVYLAHYGDYGALNARLNFVKNYFELLGLTVHESGHSEADINAFEKNLKNRKEEIIVLCALDDHYPLLSSGASEVTSPFKYIAGKFEMPHYKNLFAGQNVYEVLENLVASWEGRKS